MTGHCLRPRLARYGRFVLTGLLSAAVVSSLSWPQTAAAANLAGEAASNPAAAAPGPSTAAADTDPVSPGWHSIEPRRILDTRTGTPTRLTAGETITLDVTEALNIPDPTVHAVTLNLTAVQPSNTGFLTIYPHGAQRPNASALSYDAGEIVANHTVVKLNRAGKLDIYAHAEVDVIVDVTGYVTDFHQYVGIVPMRVLDSREEDNRWHADDPHAVKMTGGLLAPELHTEAVVLDVTVTQPEAPGYVTAYPAGSPRPLGSQLSYDTGSTITSTVVVLIGDAEEVMLESHTNAHMIVDLVGYLPKGSGFIGVPVQRAIDTRAAARPAERTVAAGQTLDVPVTNIPGAPQTPVKAALIALTLVDPESDGYATAFAGPAARPLASSLNYTPGATVTNSALVPVDDAGNISVYVQKKSNAIVDVMGFVPEDNSEALQSPLPKSSCERLEFGRPECWRDDEPLLLENETEWFNRSREIPITPPTQPDTPDAASEVLATSRTRTAKTVQVV